MSTAPPQGLALSMAIQRQRALLDEIGERVGTPVCYLKAAWADPVLYGGRGQRTGVDVDILVAPSRFEAFAAELTKQGFTRQVHPRHPVSGYAGKDWTFGAPRGLVQVDLHRALAVVPWFDLLGDGPLSRAIAYESTEGPILSLSPEDQVVFLAAHYATHVFALDDRHITDVVKLLERWPVDWEVVVARAREAHLLAALHLVSAGLAGRGAAVPDFILRPEARMAVRLRALERFIAQPTLERRAARTPALDLLVVLPLLCDRPSGLLRFLVWQGRHRIADLRERG